MEKLHIDDFTECTNVVHSHLHDTESHKIYMKCQKEAKYVRFLLNNAILTMLVSSRLFIRKTIYQNRFMNGNKSTKTFMNNTKYKFNINECSNINKLDFYLMYYIFLNITKYHRS